MVFCQYKNKCTFAVIICGSSSVGRASASQAEGREFESRLPLVHHQALIGLFR